MLSANEEIELLTLYEHDYKANEIKRLSNDIFKPLFDNKDRYLVLVGGGGSGKSIFAGSKILWRLVNEKPHRLLVVRKVARTLRESCFQQLRSQISQYYNYQDFDINKTDMKITYKNGNEILFAGLDDVEKLKSIYNISGIWIEEASELEIEDYRQLDIRLRGQTANYKQIIFSFNPVSVTHWLKAEFFDIQKPDTKTIHSTYKHNQYLDDEAKKVLESFKETDPYYYAVYCLGEWGVIGNTVFDAEKVTLRLSAVKQSPGQRGRIEPDGLGKYKFVEDINGNITIYEHNKDNAYPYIIGADVAEGLQNGDYSAAHVLDNITYKQVAVYHGHIDPDLFSEELLKLGYYYNTALINVEINKDSVVMRNLERLKYPKLYVREKIDDYTHKLVKKHGWLTTETSRRYIISNLVEYVRDHTELINDIKTLEEMLVFVRNEKGRPEAQEGKHDDLVLSLAIALETAMSGQQHKSMPGKTIDYDKLKKMEEDYQNDFWQATPEQRLQLAKQWNLYK